MIFFSKKKEVVLDCFTTCAEAYEIAKPNYATHFYPEWFKKTKCVDDNGSYTIRNCIGLIDYYKTGIVLPSWFSARITVTEKMEDGSTCYWERSSPTVVFDSHPVDQFINFSLGNYFNIKINSVWFFKTNRNVSFVCGHPLWNLPEYMKNKFYVLPGVMNYYYQHYTNINLLFEHPNNIGSKIEISPLDPLVIIHPMTEETVQLRCHLVDEKEIDKLMAIENSVWKGYSTSFYDSKKKIQDRLDKLNSCPFRRK